MRILIGLTYYRPHYSGLTIYTERLAKGLARLGHEVTVCTSQYDAALPREEMCDGVRVLRLPVRLRLSKGVIMPSLPLQAARLLANVDVVNLHMPQMDAAYISWMARLMRRPVVMTYHCDMELPAGFINRVANFGANLASHATALAAAIIVTNTRDYAENSRILRRYLRKVRVIPPPVELPEINESQVHAFRQKVGITPDQRIIGMNARLATEKGVEYLIEAMPLVLQKYPQARVLHVGQYQNVLGEEKYAQKLAPLIERLDGHWSFLGVLSPEDQAAFFHASEMVVLPSINATESFGMVQVEAMTCGTPAVASDLPGVRIAVRETGMGRIVPPRDPRALAVAITDILDAPDHFAGDPLQVKQRYSVENIASQYEKLFTELTSQR